MSGITALFLGICFLIILSGAAALVWVNHDFDRQRAACVKAGGTPVAVSGVIICFEKGVVKQ